MGWIDDNDSAQLTPPNLAQFLDTLKSGIANLQPIRIVRVFAQPGVLKGKTAMNDVVDLALEKMTTAKGRAGSATERAAKMSAAGVPNTAIAEVLTDSSKRLGNNNKYNAKSVETLVNLWADAQKGTPIAKPVVKALVKDQQDNGGALPA